jgi:uncharacterized protein YoxC
MFVKETKQRLDQHDQKLNAIDEDQENIYKQIASLKTRLDKYAQDSDTRITESVNKLSASIEELSASGEKKHQEAMDNINE